MAPDVAGQVMGAAKPFVTIAMLAAKAPARRLRRPPGCRLSFGAVVMTTDLMTTGKETLSGGQGGRLASKAALVFPCVPGGRAAQGTHRQACFASGPGPADGERGRHH